MMIDDSLIFSRAELQKNIATGKVIPIQVHGRQLFVTPEQARRLSGSNWMLIAWLVGAAVLIADRWAGSRTR